MAAAGPKARLIPAWGDAPCRGHNKAMSANGAIHPCGSMDGWMVADA